MPKIRHGISQCKFVSQNGSGDMPGAVEIVLNGYYDTDISGTLNVPSMLSHVENLGYTGKLRLVMLPDSFCTAVLGWSGKTEMHTSGKPVPFSLSWKVKGTGEIFTLHKCFALKPDFSAKTDEKGVTVSIVEIPLYAYYTDSGSIMTIG